MSPRVRGARLKWWVIGPAVGLWLAAVIVLSAAAAPATASDAATTIPTTAAVAESETSEAPILTLIVAAVGISAVAVRPARRVVARRRVR